MVTMEDVERMTHIASLVSHFHVELRKCGVPRALRYQLCDAYFQMLLFA